MTVLSIVVPVFNEELAIKKFSTQVPHILNKIEDIDYEIVFVDDGSSDSTSDSILKEREENSRICLIRLSRNFGKEAALTAGLDSVSGDATVIMDVDLQDPPELIYEFVRYWRNGYDVVYGRRVSRDADTKAKRQSASLFYNTFNRMSGIKIEPNVGDFRLMSRSAVETTLQLRERNRFMKGIFAWAGFKSIGVPYARPKREDGNSKFNYWKLWNLALDGFTSFSTIPLRIWSYIGGIVAIGAILYTIFIVLRTLIYGVAVPGYASLMVVILLLGSIQLISLGVIGEYLGRLYIETKQRPIYVIRERFGVTKPLPSKSEISEKNQNDIP